MCLPAGPRLSPALLTPLWDREHLPWPSSCLPGEGEAALPHSLMEEGASAPEKMRPWGLQASVCGYIAVGSQRRESISLSKP